jgi:hypothetical protein
MGQYCKAFPLSAVRQYDGWQENASAFRKDESAETAESNRPHDDHIVYVQENYVVTDGIFIDEHVIFDDVTDAWKDFCHNTLKFELPHEAESLTANA